MAEAPVWQPNLVAPASPDEATAPSADAAAPGPGATPDAGASLAKEPVRARRAGSTTALLVIAAMVAIGGVGFATGRATAPAQSGTGTTNVAANGVPALGAIPSGVVPGLDDRGGLGGGDFGASTITGTVVSTTSSSITIKLASGQTVTVATGSSTTYHSQTTASSTDVTAGATVLVQTSAAAGAAGPEGAAGSRTATNVIITGK
jgi:hypothetical protein